MKLAKTYKFRLDPTPAQAEMFARIAGCCRLVYNLGLEQRRDHWRRHKAATGKSISWYSQKNELPALKKEFAFLSEVPSHCLQMALKDLDSAYQNFFSGRAGYPRPRQRGLDDSFRFPDPAQFHLGRSWLVVPKFGRRPNDSGRLRIRAHRKVKGRIKTVTIIRNGRHWYACLSTLREVPGRKPKTRKLRVTGLDRGVTNPIVTSDGSFLGAATETAAERRKTERLAQSVSRKKKGSANRMKAVLRLAQHKAKMARRRKDAAHKISHDLVKNHDVIVLEDLKTRAMTRSAKGTIDTPGSGVRQKAGLNREILDRGWGMVGEMIACKAAWADKRVIKVAPHYSSQECACCGHVSDLNRPSQATFACVSCGHVAHADVNAARVIRARGIKILEADGLSASACGRSGTGRLLKQEKTAGSARGQDQTSSEARLPAH